MPIRVHPRSVFAPRAALDVGPLPTGVMDDSGFISAKPLTTLTAQPVVWACVRVMSMAVARSRWKVVDDQGIEVVAPADLIPVDRGLNTTRLEKWRVVVEQLMLNGNAYLYQNGVGVWDPAFGGRVERVGRGGRRRRYHLTTAAGTEVTLTDAEVVAFHGSGYDGLEAPSPIQRVASQTLALMEATQSNQQSNLVSGAQGRGVLIMGDQMFGASKDKRDEIALSIAEAYDRTRKKGAIPVLPAGVLPGTMGGVSPADLQMIELLRWNIEDVCRVFGVPPRQVFHYNRDLRAVGFESQAVDWQRSGVEPICDMLADTMSERIFRDGPIMDRHYELDSSRLSLGTYTEQVAAHTDAIAGGLRTPNECRLLMGDPPHPEGNELFTPAGTPETNPNESQE